MYAPLEALRRAARQKNKKTLRSDFHIKNILYVGLYIYIIMFVMGRVLYLVYIEKWHIKLCRPYIIIIINIIIINIIIIIITIIIIIIIIKIIQSFLHRP